MQGFLQKHSATFNTAVLSILGIIGKVASVLFKIILIVLIGTVGIGYYQLTFPLFVFLFSVSSVGISTTLTMNIAENGWENSLANGSVSFAKRLTLLVSVFAGTLLIVVAPLISRLQGNKEVTIIYFSIAFAVVSVSLLTFYRAILRGNKLVKEYAVSDIIEQISKLFLCIVMASLFKKISVVFSVVGVFIGIMLSSFISLIYISIVLKRTEKLEHNQLKNITNLRKSLFIKNSSIAGLSSVLIPFVQFIESVVVIGLLCKTGYNPLQATSLFGVSRGNVSALLNLPNTIILAIEFLLLPDVLSLKSNAKISKKTQATISIALCLGVFIAAMFYLFGDEILGFVYGKSLSGIDEQVARTLLKIGSISVVFLSVGQVQSVVLQGIKKLHLPIVSLGVSSTIKLLFEIVFINEFGIYAVEISNVLFYISLCFVNTIFLIKNKINFGTPQNILFIILILAWVVAIRLVYNVVSNTFGFVFAILLALVMTSLLCGAIAWPVIIKMKKKKNKLIA